MFLSSIWGRHSNGEALRLLRHGSSCGRDILPPVNICDDAAANFPSGVYLADDDAQSSLLSAGEAANRREGGRVVGWRRRCRGRRAQMVLALVNQKPFRCKCHASAKLFRSTVATSNVLLTSLHKRTQKWAMQKIRNLKCFFFLFIRKGT